MHTVTCLPKQVPGFSHDDEGHLAALSELLSAGCWLPVRFSMLGPVFTALDVVRTPVLPGCSIALPGGVALLDDT